jgi:GntR family phosphonate transport system transcriptional regulator
MAKAARPARRNLVTIPEAPVWRRIEQQLIGDIAKGTYPRGARLPAEPELVARFGVNRLTVRQALSSLQSAGYIRIERGRGTFVQREVVKYELGERVRFSQNILAVNRTPTRTLIKSGQMPADADLADQLELAEGDSVVYLWVVGEADGEPLLFGKNFYPGTRFRTLPTVFREVGSLTKALKAFQIEDYKRKSTKLIARLPTTEEARYLAQPRNEPIIETRSIDVDLLNRRISFSITCFSADRIQFVMGDSTDRGGP